MKTFVPGKTYIPPSGQEITQEDKDYLHNVVNSGWYTDGTECVRFRKELSKRVAGYVTLVNSGSSASLVAISSLVEWIGKIRDFTYVLTCATGFPTTVSPIYQCGKSPIYVDIDPRTLSPDIFQIKQAVKAYGKEIGFAVFAHTLGFPYMEYGIREMLGDGPPPGS